MTYSTGGTYIPSGCCCLSSKTYGRNGTTPIFRSFHRTASSTTGGRSRWPFNVFILLNIMPSTTVSFLDLKDDILFLQCLSFFFFLCSFP